MLLLFHGFGQDHTAFDALAPILEERYTCYSIDLFFHGGSIWKKGEQPITIPEWKTIIQHLLEKENIQRFSLMGYSMGARFAICAFDAQPHVVDALFLIAPAGITKDRWYTLATSTPLMRAVFKSMIAHGDRFLTLSKWLAGAGLLHKRTARFAELQMNTREKREQVYYSWVTFRALQVPAQQLAASIELHKPTVTLLLGTRDTVITEQKITPLLKLLKHEVTLHRVDVSHHQLLRKEVGERLFI